MKVFQIYFDDSQQAGLDYIPYRNDDCTVYFENSVIKNLVESGAHEGCDYFGVVSYRLRAKLAWTRSHWRHSAIWNVSNRTFTPGDFEAELLRRAPDAMSFQQHIPHDPVTLANHFHQNFSDYFARVMAAIGYPWRPTVFDDIFYFTQKALLKTRIVVAATQGRKHHYDAGFAEGSRCLIVRARRCATTPLNGARTTVSAYALRASDTRARAAWSD